MTNIYAKTTKEKTLDDLGDFFHFMYKIFVPIVIVPYLVVLARAICS